MNVEVATSVARARNAPPAAPNDPDALRFWRIKVDAGIDTDQDGSPDWAEFQMAANGSEGTVAGVVGDAFNADTNGDGIPDGLQIDSDQDCTPDADDPAVSDDTASFPIGPLPRYALFPITTAEPLEQTDARQISDKGTVLYDNETWTSGIWTPLTIAGSGITTKAIAINDQNQILGWGSRFHGTSLSYLETVCFWNSPNAVCSWALLGEGASEKFAGIPGDEAHWASLSPGPGRENIAIKGPICLNGEWKGISQYAPGVPELWNSGPSLFSTPHPADGFSPKRAFGHASTSHIPSMPSYCRSEWTESILPSPSRLWSRPRIPRNTSTAAWTTLP